MSTASFTQVTARVRNDDGSEAAASWRQAQGTNDTVSPNQNFRVRFRIDETASVAWTSKVWNLRYSLNGGAYTAVSGSTPVQFVASSQFVDGADCTAQLTGGTGTFVTDNNGMKETTGGATNSGSAGFLFETEWNLKIDSAQVAVGNTIDLRIYDGTSAIAAYTFTPRITVGEFQRTNTDTATAAETQAANGAVSQVDTVSASDANSGATAISAADTAAAADTNSESGTAVNADTGSAADAQSLSGTASLAEIATAGEAQAASGSSNIADTASAGDATAVSNFIAVADTASAGESQDFSLESPFSDSASAGETQSSAAGVTNADTPAAADQVSSPGTAVLADNAAAGEAQAIAATSSLGDSASAADSNSWEELIASSDVSINDSAVANESQVLSGVLGQPDMAIGVDEFLGHVDIVINDLASAGDASEYLRPFELPNAPLSFELNAGQNLVDLNSGQDQLQISGSNSLRISGGQSSLSING